jgi:hypothetical protein
VTVKGVTALGVTVLGATVLRRESADVFSHVGSWPQPHEDPVVERHLRERYQIVTIHMRSNAAHNVVHRDKKYGGTRNVDRNKKHTCWKFAFSCWGNTPSR